MIAYPKTPNLFKRDPDTKKVIVGQYSDPVFAYLRQNRWTFEEKLNGTNMRLLWHGLVGSTEIINHIVTASGMLELRGRTDKAEIPVGIQRWFDNHFDEWNFRILRDMFPNCDVCIYGEGVGEGIQKGGEQYGEPHFRAFDIKVGDLWLKRHDVDAICIRLNIQRAPLILEGSLDVGLEFAQNGFKTLIGPNPWKYYAEGLVARPSIPLLTRDGKRIICKLKHEDLYTGDTNGS